MYTYVLYGVSVFVSVAYVICLVNCQSLPNNSFRECLQIVTCRRIYCRSKAPTKGVGPTWKCSLQPSSLKPSHQTARSKCCLYLGGVSPEIWAKPWMTVINTAVRRRPFGEDFDRDANLCVVRQLIRLQGGPVVQRKRFGNQRLQYTRGSLWRFQKQTRYSVYESQDISSTVCRFVSQKAHYCEPLFSLLCGGA